MQYRRYDMIVLTIWELCGILLPPPRRLCFHGR